MIDWRDPARRDVIRFQMIDPNNLDEVYGDLTDVQLGSSSILYGYETDTRYSSGISFLKSNNYVENAWVRIIHEVPSDGYVNELGTFIPTSPSETRQGAVIVSLDLQSPLWGLKEDLITSKFSVGKKTSLLEAIKRICDTCNRPYIFNNPNDVTADKAIVYDVGESYLSILFDLCDQTNNRMDLDGHGRITFGPSPDHATLTPIWTLDYDDPRSMIIEGSLKMETSVDEMPNRAIVVNEKNIGVADVADGLSYSIRQRGYVKAEKYEDKKATNKTKANDSAVSHLKKFTKTAEWTMDCLYFPCHPGDNVTFVLDGIKHACMIHNIDSLELETMTMGLTLKEVLDEQS